MTRREMILDKAKSFNDLTQRCAFIEGAEWADSNPVKTGHTGVECSECKKRMFSYSPHDYKICGCPNETMVDGGFDYYHFGWKNKEPRRINYDPKLDGPLPKPRYSRFPY